MPRSIAPRMNEASRGWVHLVRMIAQTYRCSAALSDTATEQGVWCLGGMCWCDLMQCWVPEASNTDAWGVAVGPDHTRPTAICCADCTE